MKTNKELDKWAAEKCSVIINQDGYWYLEKDGDKPCESWREAGWTLSDARCREVVRENFGISTYPCQATGKKWTSEGGINADGYFDSNTIAESEIACIAAIMEAE